jgi:glutathione-regulated potassium-efflux system protein KefB
MHADAGEYGLILPILILLGATVAAAPIARRFGLSAVVGYLAAGIVIGPFGFGLFSDTATILNIAELGVVLLLFLIGLELKLSRLSALKRAIFGLGFLQLSVTTIVFIPLALYGLGLGFAGAIVASISLAMSATSIALQILDERGDLQTPYGQRAFAILLFQDMAIVPILAIIPLLSPWQMNDGGGWMGGVIKAAEIAGIIVAVFLAGRYLLNPAFQLLARSNAREVMTAAALLVVIGTGLAMQAAGMSMGLGAFLAGLVLAESSYRHELEADIEPFRGLLLALFFMGVGMSIDVVVVRENAFKLLLGAIVVTVLKAAIIWLLANLFRKGRIEPIRTAAILTPAGEFAFVLIPLGLSLVLLTTRQASIVIALAGMTMLIGPPFATLVEWLRTRKRNKELPVYDMDGLEQTHGSVLIIGFGRFGQIVSQCLLAQEIDVTVIDNDAEMIEAVARFGFKIYYGDGARLDVLRAAHADKMRLIAVCTDGAENTEHIVDVIQANFPDVKLYVRSFDRASTLALLGKNVDYEIRETFESAISFGRATLTELGSNDDTIDEIVEDVRLRDRERLALQQAGGIYAGVDKMRRAKPKPEPFTGKKRESEALNQEAQVVIQQEEQKELAEKRSDTREDLIP